MESIQDMECRKRCASYRASISDMIEYSDGIPPFSVVEYDSIIAPHMKPCVGSLAEEKHLEALILLVARRVYTFALDTEEDQNPHDADIYDCPRD